MTELHLRGREIVPFLATVALNKFDPFPVRKAKQIVVASPDGYLVGDAILFHEESDFLRIVGARSRWTGCSTTLTRRRSMSQRRWTTIRRSSSIRAMSSASRCRDRKRLELVTEAAGGSLPEVKFFSIAELTIAGKPVRASAAWDGWNPGLRDLRQVGRPGGGAGRARADRREAWTPQGRRAGLSTTAQESGWMPLPLPAIYHGDELNHTGSG